MNKDTLILVALGLGLYCWLKPCRGGVAGLGARGRDPLEQALGELYALMAEYGYLVRNTQVGGAFQSVENGLKYIHPASARGSERQRQEAAVRGMIQRIQNAVNANYEPNPELVMES